MDATGHDPTSNRLLANLPRNDLQALLLSTALVELHQGVVLFEPGDEVDQIYFPLSGMVSLVLVMQDGKAIETATVGREGVIGAMAGLGLHVAKVRAIAQLPGQACRISAAQLRRAAEMSKPIAAICHGPQLLAAAGVLRGKACSCYPAVGPEVVSAGGSVPEVPIDGAHVDGNLVTAPAWPAHPEWLRLFLEVLGTTITV